MTECACCYDLLSKAPQSSCMPCRHIFHTACIEAWRQTLGAVAGGVSCPLCRRLAVIAEKTIQSPAELDVYMREFAQSKLTFMTQTTATVHAEQLRRMTRTLAKVSNTRDRLRTHDMIALRQLEANLMHTRMKRISRLRKHAKAFKRTVHAKELKDEYKALASERKRIKGYIAGYKEDLAKLRAELTLSG
jgi:hypothetical protein